MNSRFLQPDSPSIFCPFTTLACQYLLHKPVQLKDTSLSLFYTYLKATLHLHEQNAHTVLAGPVDASGLGGLNSGLSLLHISSFFNGSGLSVEVTEVLLGLHLGVQVLIQVRKFMGL